MKKISILLFAAMMAGSLSAQIESFSEEDTFVSEPVKPAFNKFDYLQPFKGGMSPKIRCGIAHAIKNGDTPSSYQILAVYNLIGEQLFSVKDAKITSKNNYYMIVNNKTNLALEKIQQGKYYTVKDILISKEDIDSLGTLFNELPFITDTLYYDLDARKLLDRTEPLPQDAKQCLVSKSAVLRLLQPAESYIEWPTKSQIINSRNFEPEQAIYVLSDETGKECYIPLYTQYNYDVLSLKCEITIATRTFIFKSSEKVYVQMGELAQLDAFALVEGYTILKKIFENQRLIDRDKNEYLCKKIALKDGQVVAAITDTLSTKVSYFQIVDFCDTKLSYWYDDKIKVLAVGKQRNNNGEDEKVDFWFFTKHDMDSVEAKIAYEKQKAEQEARKKDERKRQDLIKKYGAKIGQSIADGKACVGMNKEQCQEAMGTPNSIAKDTNNLGAVEVWTYSLGYQMFGGIVPVTVVTFINGKVTSVKEYTSWP